MVLRGCTVRQEPENERISLHDGRCPTLEDAVEYFNLIQQLHLTAQEKTELVAFLRAM